VFPPPDGGTAGGSHPRNDFFLRELSGWKGEINRLSDQIASQFMASTQNIIQLLNRGKNEG
jgi:hypothetical protein